MNNINIIDQNYLIIQFENIQFNSINCNYCRCAFTLNNEIIDYRYASIDCFDYVINNNNHMHQIDQIDINQVKIHKSIYKYNMNSINLKFVFNNCHFDDMLMIFSILHEYYNYCYSTNDNDQYDFNENINKFKFNNSINITEQFDSDSHCRLTDKLKLFKMLLNTNSKFFNHQLNNLPSINLTITYDHKSLIENVIINDLLSDESIMYFDSESDTESIDSNQNDFINNSESDNANSENDLNIITNHNNEQIDTIQHQNQTKQIKLIDIEFESLLTIFPTLATLELNDCRIDESDKYITYNNLSRFKMLNTLTQSEIVDVTVNTNSQFDNQVNSTTKIYTTYTIDRQNKCIIKSFQTN